MQPAIRITLAASSPAPTFTGGPFVSGVAQCTTGAAATGWTRDYIVEIGAVGERVDIATGGNYAQLLDTEIILSNHDGWLGLLDDAGGSAVGALVEVGSISGATLSTRWSGTVADPLMDGAAVTMRVESILAKRHREIPARAVTSAEFPGIPASSDGAPVPIVYGAVDGMTPPTILSNVDYLPAQYTRFSGVNVARASTFVPVYSGVPAVTLSTAVFCLGVTEAGGSVPAGVATAIYDAQNAGKSVFIEVTDGTGSGQSRRLVGYATASGNVEPGNGFRVGWLSFDIASPWDTLIDATSVLRIYADEVGASLAVGDEATVSRVVAYSGDNEYPIAYSVQTTSGIVIADVSSEFRNGEDYAALEYRAPTSVFGVPEMSDLVTVTTSNDVDGITSVVNAGIGYDFRTWDGYCRGRIEFGSIPSDAIRDEADIYVLASLDASDLVKDSDDVSAPIKAWPQVIVRRFVGADYRPQMVVGDTPGAVAIPFDSFNAFPPAIATDGTAGQFQSYAWKIPALPFPLSAIASIEWAVIMSARPNGFPQLAAGRVHAERSTGNNMVRPPVYMTPLPSVGQFVRPLNGGDGAIHNGVSGTSGATVYQSGQWREVTGIVDANTFTVTDSSAWPYYNLDYMIVDAAQLATVHERETGVAFVYGAITRDSQFEVSTSAGRTFGAHWPELPAGISSGDPITLARDAVLDILYRDLSLVAAQVDFASFQALPGDTIASVLSDRGDSAQRVADLCQQFNWVISHDATGRETATAWMSRVMSTTDFDYTIDTGDMIEGSISGRDVTDIQDLVNQPRMEWDYTQADGFRQVSNVVDVSADPSTLTAENYLATVSGFGDFSTSLEVYRALHKSYKINDYRRSATFSFPDAGGNIDSLLWPMWGLDRLQWIATRKPVLRFSMPESSSVGLPVVGRRAKIRHKRYTRNAWAYGTIVESSWESSSEEASFSVAIMLDPGYLLDPESGLFEDTIDATGTVEQYIDSVDGISEQYIDTLGET